MQFFKIYFAIALDQLTDLSALYEQRQKPNVSFVNNISPCFWYLFL